MHYIITTSIWIDFLQSITLRTNKMYIKPLVLCTDQKSTRHYFFLSSQGGIFFWQFGGITHENGERNAKSFRCP